MEAGLSRVVKHGSWTHRSGQTLVSIQLKVVIWKHLLNVIQRSVVAPVAEALWWRLLL